MSKIIPFSDEYDFSDILIDEILYNTISESKECVINLLDIKGRVYNSKFGIIGYFTDKSKKIFKETYPSQFLFNSVINLFNKTSEYFLGYETKDFFEYSNLLLITEKSTTQNKKKNEFSSEGIPIDPFWNINKERFNQLEKIVITDAKNKINHIRYYMKSEYDYDFSLPRFDN